MPTFKQKHYTSEAGNKYLFQHPGVRTVSKINDASKNKHGVVLEERLAEEILKHVIVDPKMRIDDFADYKEYAEVINSAHAFVMGSSEDNDSSGSNQQGGGEAKS